MQQLRDYQELAVAFFQKNDRAALFLDMGLGKTAITLSALTADHLPALVIAPKRVAEHVWPTEVRKWRPDLSLVVAKGTRTQRFDLLRAGADITVLGRDNIRDVSAKVASSVRTVVLDELSGFKAPGSKRWRAARSIVRTATVQHVWGLTGTPAPNGLLDLWSQIYLLDQGQRLGPTLGGYRNRYFVPGRRLPNGIVSEWIARPESPAAIHSAIEDICLAMDSDGKVTLPPLTFNTVEVPLSSRARHVYRNLKRDLVVNLDLLGKTHTAATAAALTNRLAQISAGFIYDDDGLGGYSVLHHEKVQAVQEIVDGTGSPVLVFYRFKAERDLIAAAVPGVRLIDEPNAIDDWNAGQVRVLLAHPASVGHGLNLQFGGHTVVWSSLPWSLEEWEQANARLHRSGQASPVIVHVLQSPRTVDAAVKDALQNKSSVQDALLAHLESPI